MVKLAEDTVNDITIFKTFHSGAPYHVRYGLQVEKSWSMEDALRKFQNCQKHALTAAGHYEEKDDEY